MQPTQKNNSATRDSSSKKQVLTKTLFSIAGVVLVGFVIFQVIAVAQRQASPGAESGVGADGFRAFAENDGDIGIGSAISKDQVISALGGNAKSVGNAQISKVFNLNGIRRQQVTFDFKLSSNATAELYVDKIMYTSEQALKKDGVYEATISAGTINDSPIYFRRALTLGKYREYSIMLVKDSTVYRFVIAQPNNSIIISEIDASAILKKVALSTKI